MCGRGKTVGELRWLKFNPPFSLFPSLFSRCLAYTHRMSKEPITDISVFLSDCLSSGGYIYPIFIHNVPTIFSCSWRAICSCIPTVYVTAATTDGRRYGKNMAFVPKLRVLCVAFGMPGVLSSSGEFPGIARIGSCKWLDGGQVLLTVTRKAGETDLRTRHAGDPDGGPGRESIAECRECSRWW